MGENLRFIVGITGDAASMLLFAAPILTFWRVIRKKSTEGFSCVPYILALLNCFTYTWYGLPVVSNKWENAPLAAINGLGVLLELSFILVYLCFAPTRSKSRIGIMATGIIIVCGAIAIISTFTLKDEHNRKLFVGSIGIVASVAMYGSPLVAVKQVIESKSVEFMPFYLSFFSLLSSSSWMAYGLLGHDMFVASPNFLGCPLCILQLALYFNFKYNKRGSKAQNLEIEKRQEIMIRNPIQHINIVVSPNTT